MNLMKSRYNRVSFQFAQWDNERHQVAIMSDQKQSVINASAQSCPYCQRRFATIDLLNLHIVTRHVHSGKKTEREPAQTGGSKR
jgi:hypothetical protein